jgi:hypothetical protein
MRLAVVLGLAFVVSGCATYSWHHPTVPPEITQRDSEECRDRSRRLVALELMGDDPFWWGPGWRYQRAPFGPMTSGLAMEQDAYDRCMRSKGYALVKDPPRASGSQ